MNEIKKVFDKYFPRSSQPQELKQVVSELEKLQADVEGAELLIRHDIRGSIRRIETTFLRYETSMRDIERLTTDLEISVLQYFPSDKGDTKEFKKSNNAVADFWNKAMGIE